MMKQIILVSYILLAVMTVTSCKKVEKDLTAQYDQPSVSSESFPLPDGKELAYPKNVKPGDTISVAGRFNLEKGAVIRLGNENAVPVYSETMDYTYYLTGTHYKFEIVKFVVTPGMGAGPQPLVVTYGAYRHQAPDINIMTTDISGSSPDTTLVIKEIFDGSLPDFQNRYGKFPANDMFQEALTLTSDGTVYFASRWDIYRFKNGQIEWLLKMEDGIRIGGELVTIKQILGMAPNKEGSHIYISLEATVDVPDMYNLITYLVKKDLVTGAVTLLNKTEREVNQWGSRTGNTRPANSNYDGPISETSLSALDLKVDAKGRLIFNNKENSSYGRLDDAGNITSLLASAFYQGSNSLMKYQKLLGFTPDGSAAFISDKNTSNPNATSLVVVDLEELEIIDAVESGMEFYLASFDPNPARRMAQQIGYFNAGTSVHLKGTYLPISRKEMLYINSFSIASVNPEQSYIYAYAGLERGCSHLTNPQYLLPDQKELTGPALYVNYGFVTGFGQMRIIGQDAAGKIYFMRGGQRILFPRSYIAPRIYTLEKP